MAARFEYKFVRLDETTPKALFGLIHAATYQEANVYQQAVHEHAAEGWRLVQIFAPPIAAPYGAAMFYELIFERPLPVGDN
jgi:hypothetical protein